MRKSLLFIFVFCALFVYGQQNISRYKTIVVKDSIDLPYNTYNPIYSIDVLPPNLILTPHRGGVLVVNTKEWLISPNDSLPIKSFSFDRKTGDLLYTNKKDSLQYLIALKGSEKNTISVLKGNGIRMFKSDSTVLVNGIAKNGSHLLHVTKPNYELKTVFNFDHIIVDATINEGIAFLLFRRSVFILDLETEELFKFYNSSEDLFGISLLNKNTLLISSNNNLKLLTIGSQQNELNINISKKGVLYDFGKYIAMHSYAMNKVYLLEKIILSKLLKH